MGGKTRFSMEFSGQLAIGFCVFLRPPRLNRAHSDMV